VIGQPHRRHRSQEFCQFPYVIEAQCPPDSMCILLWTTTNPQNCHHLEMVAKRSRFDVQFTPTGRILDQPGGAMVRRTHQQANSTGRVPHCKRLEAAIREYIDVHNEDPKPFVWTKTADQMLDQHRSLRAGHDRL
jgi:hypothetical protein